VADDIDASGKVAEKLAAIAKDHLKFFWVPD
jgi:hypothetical protein